MRSRYTVRNPERAHFVTSTIVDWLPVFQTPACCDILVGSLEFCQREKGLRLYAWVILDNHFHAVVSSEQLPRVMADLEQAPFPLCGAAMMAMWRRRPAVAVSVSVS
jgi:putative transposase